MSGESYSDDCPRCGAKDALQGYRDWKPYDQVSATCINCGFRVDTVTEIATLLEVNEKREEAELAPLEELAKPLKEWLEWGYEPAGVNEAKTIAENIAGEILKQTDTADVANMIDDTIYDINPLATADDKGRVLAEFQCLIKRLEE